jgi:hypothetical protein
VCKNFCVPTTCFLCDGDCIAVHVEKRGNGYIASRGEQGGSCATSPLIGVELDPMSGMLYHNIYYNTTTILSKADCATASEQ